MPQLLRNQDSLVDITMSFRQKSASPLFLSLAVLFLAVHGPVEAFASSSILGMGAETGTPSGDVRAAILKNDARNDSVVGIKKSDADKAKEAQRPAILRDIEFKRPVRLGIQARIGNSGNSATVSCTKEYLVEMFNPSNINVYYLSDRDLSAAIRTDQVDFFIADADFFALEQSLGTAHQIATLWPRTADTPLAATASVFFMKRTPERQMRSLPLGTVTGHDFVATNSASLGGWLAGAAEIVRNSTVSFESLNGRADFLGQDPMSVVTAVLRDPQKVGVLPACELERLAQTKELELDDFTFIGLHSSDGLRCLHSTRAYPSWVFGSVVGTDLTLLNAATSLLLTMKGSPYSGEWAIPVSNREIYDLFYDLKIGPYQDLAGWSLQRYVREHAEMIAVVLLLVFLVISYTMTLSILVRRRTRALREALEDRDRIEAEASQSRQHIANLERTGIVGQMSTIIAHELKQPLGAITNYSNGLLRRLRRGSMNPAQFEEALGEIVLQAERASKIVERVRSYAKHDFPPRKVADLSIIIENAIQTFRRSRTTNAELVVRMHSRSMASVDSWEIELAILNLMKNAADATVEVGKPRIEVELIPGDEENWILTVADNGPYLTDEQLSRFFKPLQTSKGAAGMGLGLSIVANIAERHAGNITVARNGECGVKFTMTIPRQIRLGEGDASEEVEMGPETVSIYEAGGNGPVVRSTVEPRPLKTVPEDETDSLQMPKTVHTGGLSQAVNLMEGGVVRTTGHRIKDFTIDESDMPRNA